MTRNHFALLLALAGAGCVDVATDTNEGTPGPTVEFDPASSIIPFPNNLVLDPATGKVKLPMQCNESPAQTAIRAGVLNTLDGFGTFKTALQVTLTDPVDPDTLPTSVKLYRRATGTTPVDPSAAEATDLLIIPGMTTRYLPDCSATETVDALTLIAVNLSTGTPIPVPLAEDSTYDVVVTDTLKTATGAAFLPSFTWALVRQTDDPVTVQNGQIVAERTPLDPVEDAERLLGIDLLWKAHTQAVGFLEAATGTTRDHFLLAWEFNTQTATRPLDPTSAGSPAAMLNDLPILGGTSITGAQTPAEYLSDPTRLGPAVCAAIGCTSIGAILGGVLRSANYQVIPTADPKVPGGWTDPLSPTKQGDDALLQVAIFLPATAAPANGYPTIVYGHGLGSSKDTLAVIAPALARAGFATVAIDFVAHGSRAVQISTEPTIGCGGTPKPTTAPQCFAPIFSSNLAATRDNVRQTVLDLQQLVRSVKACTVASPCGQLSIDPENVGYIGISLGGIIGSMVAAESDGLESAVTNVAGAGLIDIIENTDTLAIKCSLVDALIDAGVVTGDKWNLGMNTTTAACLTDDWKAQASYRQFANIARWVLDSADPANYAAKLATRTTLLQEVIDDHVVPNIATDQLGALSARAPAPGDPIAAPPFTPSAALTGSPTTSHWVTYTNLPADAGTGFPGNTFHHASLLQPAPSIQPSGQDGNLGTARVQTDAIYFLIQNVIAN